MSIFAIVITFFLEKAGWLTTIRNIVQQHIDKYLSLLLSSNLGKPSRLRWIYLFACIPVWVILLTLQKLLSHHQVVLFIIYILLFIFTVQLFTWRTEAKNTQIANKRSFIMTYATSFFCPLFWFIVLPCGTGSLSYLIFIQLSIQLKSRQVDTIIYNVVIDKMLFYANIIPYTILFIFIAFAGNFEEVLHYLLEQRKVLIKSSYFLENVLHEVVLIAIGKNKFEIMNNGANALEVEAARLDKQHFTPEITTYIVAILYRSGLFFIGLIALISLINLY